MVGSITFTSGSSSAVNCVWSNWTGTASTATEASGVVWKFWVASTTATTTNATTTATSSPWTIWASNTTVQNASVQFDNAPSEIAQRQSQLKYDIQRKRKARERRRILHNAASLLESILEPSQRLELKRHDSVTVIGSNGGAYRVVRDWEGMLWQLDPATLKPIQKLCVHPSGEYPTGDRMATLILWLRADEAAVLEKANRHGSDEKELRRVAARRTYRGWRALPREDAA